MSEMLRFCQELGLGAVLAIAIFTAFFFLLKWVLETSKDMLLKMNEERIKYLDLMNNFSDNIKANAEADRIFQSQVETAHRYAREEHQKMINSLNEIEKALGRINGYKEH